jgi:hypothetical protein
MASQNVTSGWVSDELRGLLGGRKYVKTKDLTRELLLEYAKRQGAVTEVDLLSVNFQNMGGTELEVKLEESQNTVECLKLATQDEQGISTFTQQLFLVSKSGDKDNAGDANGGSGVKQEPMKDGYMVSDSCIASGFVCSFFSSFERAVLFVSFDYALVLLFVFPFLVESHWHWLVL